MILTNIGYDAVGNAISFYIADKDHLDVPPDMCISGWTGGGEYQQIVLGLATVEDFDNMIETMKKLRVHMEKTNDVS